MNKNDFAKIVSVRHGLGWQKGCTHKENIDERPSFPQNIFEEILLGFRFNLLSDALFFTSILVFALQCLVGSLFDTSFRQSTVFWNQKICRLG
ncbi:Protein CBG26675 [Caenorhabditis briggsae]|uniref:Protein CBG26675 n=1 Tax=Caenorhabditis briggsae TaxID=6238 RepID=B6IE45_CAEBR|nr:Protein CBG26675 [Caenorhabditis briggsae]CAS01109.1 Protein CBG26675 [Caenorhabditis briggsae]